MFQVNACPTKKRLYSLVLFWQLVRGQTFDDPVFEGMVRDFMSLNHSLMSVLKGVDKFVAGVDSMCDGLFELSEVR